MNGRRLPVMMAAAALAVVLGVTLGACATGDGPARVPSATDPRSTPASPSRASPPPSASAAALPSAPPCPGHPTVSVGTAAELKAALAAAASGSVIHLKDGVYSGRFTLSGHGTQNKPIWVCGATGAVLDGGGTDGGYVLHLDGAENVRLVGFTVRNGQKGIVADHTSATWFDGLTVTRIGDEGIHLRSASSGNTVERSTITDTGLRKAKFGEGVYIGSAESNWCEVSACTPDRSDGNVIRDNTIARTAAESLDIKEGTTGGFVLGNRFDGAGMSGADSWVDVKGNRWTIAGNTGVNAPIDGFQTHEIVEGWGTDNTFSGNVANVGGSGYAYHFAPALGNRLACDNTATKAAKGLANVDCG